MDQEHNLTAYFGLASTAAAVALEMGDSPESAIRLLEIGRGVILAHLLDLRTEFKHLPSGLADQYRSLTALLDPRFSDSSLTSLTPAEQADQ